MAGLFDMTPRPVGERTWDYRLLDNIFGIDDGANTVGETLGKGINQLGTDIFSDPIGTGIGAVQALEHDLNNLMFEGGAVDRPLAVLGYAAGAALPMSAPAGALRSGALRATPPPSNAQKIADMLSGGDAERVTDSMMAQADPQEMWRLYDEGGTGANMPMDQASRISRAEGMGFDTSLPLFHGARQPFDQFKPSESGFTGRGVYTTPRADHASGYALDHGVIGQNGVEVYGRSGNFVDERDFSNATSGVSGPDSYKGKQNQAASELADNGVRGVDLSTVGEVDGVYGTHLAQRSFFNPSDLRSRFARFDPRLSHLSNLSAAAAGAAYLTPQDTIRSMYEAGQ